LRSTPAPHERPACGPVVLYARHRHHLDLGRGQCGGGNHDEPTLRAIDTDAIERQSKTGPKSLGAAGGSHFGRTGGARPSGLGQTARGRRRATGPRQGRAPAGLTAEERRFGIYGEHVSPPRDLGVPANSSGGLRPAVEPIVFISATSRRKCLTPRISPRVRAHFVNQPSRDTARKCLQIADSCHQCRRNRCNSHARGHWFENQGVTGGGICRRRCGALSELQADLRARRLGSFCAMGKRIWKGPNPPIPGKRPKPRSSALAESEAKQLPHK
jgi:hypothetical protein